MVTNKQKMSCDCLQTYPDLAPLRRGDVLVRHQPLEVVHLGPGVELEQDGALLLARELRLPEIFF